MWPKFIFKNALILIVVLMMSAFVISSIAAQDIEVPIAAETPTMEPSPTLQPTEIPTEVPTETPLPTALPTEAPTATPEISVASVEPASLTQGIGGTLTVSGENFTNDTSVWLNNSIALSVTSRSADSLAVTVGADVPAGVYSVQVSDAAGSTAAAPDLLTITAATAVPRIAISQAEPSHITAGQSGNLSIIGSNFSASTTVRLVGYGFLSTTLVNSSALTAALPTSLPAGVYAIELNDPTYGTATAPTSLTVSAAVVAVTSTPAATTTPVPGQPELVVRNFVSSPAVIYPGDSTQLTFEIVNVGSRTAEGVVVALGSSDFTPANGQSSLTLADLAADSSYTVSLSVAAPMNAEEGPYSIPLILTSRDFSSENYTDNATVSVAIAERPAGESQIILDSYLVNPTTAAPGEAITVQALFKNTGTETASQVLVQLDSANSLLIAGSQGSAFSLGDVAAGSSVPLVMPLVVASTAADGAQSQSFTITYLQDGESKQASASLSLTVEETTEASPLLLLQSYSSGQDDALQPGQQFAFELTLQNAGTVDISNLLVTFGTISNTSSSSSSSSTTSSSTGSTTTTPSDSFAIYGSGDTVLIGNLTAGETSTLTQQFIVASDLESGIHSLPITLQYAATDGTTESQTLNPGLIVVVQPRLRVSASSALDDPLTAGTETTLKLEIANLGSEDVTLTEMRVSGENVEFSDSAAVTLDPLAGDDNISQSVVFTPQAEGDYTVTVEVDYINDLNKTQTVTTTFTGSVQAAQQQTRRQMPTNFTPAQQSTENELGRLLLGFLGFGG